MVLAAIPKPLQAGLVLMLVVWVAAGVARWRATRPVHVGSPPPPRRPTPALVRVVPPVAVALMLLQEFPSGPLPLPAIYAQIGGPIRLADLIAAVCVALAVFDGGDLRHPRQLFPRSLRVPAAACALVLIVEIVVGAQHGAHNFVFQWRGALIGVALAVALGRACERYGAQRRIVLTLVVASGCYALALLINYIGGGGITALATGRTPLFDGPTCSIFGLVAVVAALTPPTLGKVEKRIVRGCGLVCALLVLLSVRRTYLMELVIALVIVLGSSYMRRRRKPIIMGAAAAVVALVQLYGVDQILARLDSFDLTSSSSQAVTNQGHIDDVALGWRQIEASPIFGLGVGGSYDASDLGWKSQSYAIHNGPLSLWLMFGLFGLLAYLWWFRTVVRELRAAAADQTDPYAATLARAGRAWLLASFLVSCAFSPWPLGATQLGTTAGLVLAVGLVRAGGRDSYDELAPQTVDLGADGRQRAPAY